MSATNSFENEMAAFIAHDTTIASLNGVTVFHLSLHTADPGEGGSQNTSEVTYIGYAREPLVRNSSGLTVSGNAFTNAAQIAFGQCTASPGSNVTHVGLGTDATGAGNLLGSFALDNPIAMAVGATPIFPIGNYENTID